jgi:hypothetical protein
VSVNDVDAGAWPCTCAPFKVQATVQLGLISGSTDKDTGTDSPPLKVCSGAGEAMAIFAAERLLSVFGLAQAGHGLIARGNHPLHH